MVLGSSPSGPTIHPETPSHYTRQSLSRVAFAVRFGNARTIRCALAQSILRQSCQAAEATSRDTWCASISTCDGDMERVRGIEPPSSGWEPGALPLSYTRPDQTHRGRTSPPEGTYIPSGVLGCKLVLRQATRRKSARLSPAAMFHAAMRPIIGRQSLPPTPSTRHDISGTCELPCPVDFAGDHPRWGHWLRSCLATPTPNHHSEAC